MLSKIVRSVQDEQEALLGQIRQSPQEIALYLRLIPLLNDCPRSEKEKLLRKLAADSKANYALFFTVQLPRAGVRKILTDCWQWVLLQPGFEQLLTDHPQALGVRNAYALAAGAFARPDIKVQQLDRLGYLWDPGYWGSLAEYQRALGALPDRHLAPPALSPLALDKIFQETPFDQLSSRQVTELLRRELWVSLDAYLAALSDPDRLLAAEQSLEAAEQSEASYRALEKQLKAWQDARPDSQAAAAALGGFYVNYAWLARGSDQPDRVTSHGASKFNQRLGISRDLLYRVFGSGYHTPGVMSNLMVIYNAESAKLDSAHKLAVQAAQSGRAGNAAILAYAQMLLALGRPGDLAAAADRLRQEVGNDDCYALMTTAAIEARGYACLEPGHPLAMDWKRSLQSLVEARKAGRISPGVARKFLEHCAARNTRQDAALILPYVPEREGRKGGENAAVRLRAEREWAAGRYQWPQDKPEATYTLNGPPNLGDGPGRREPDLSGCLYLGQMLQRQGRMETYGSQVRLKVSARCSSALPAGEVGRLAG